jgi:hypothetical protein
MRICYNPIRFWKKLCNKTQRLECTTLYPVSQPISTVTVTCAQLLSTFTKSMVWKVSFLYIVHVTNYFCGQNSIFGHMPLYITISVKSYNLLIWLFHIASYQNKTIISSGIWHLYLSYTVYQWHHSIFELWSVLQSAMAKLFECHPSLNQPKFSNFAPEQV